MKPPSPGSSATSSTWTATPFEGDPRHVLRRTLDRARDQGFSFYVAPELEYFYFAQPRPTTARRRCPSTRAPTSSSWATTRPTALRRETVLMLEEMGIPVEYSQHEDAPSQHEIDLRYTDAMTMADTVMLVRLVVKEMAAERGILATFMPKPLDGVQGSGMHTHMSLFDGDTNAFYDDSDEYHLSQGGHASSSPASSTTPARSPHHQPVGQLLQAAHHLPAGPAAYRGAGVHLLGAEQPLGARAGAPDQEGQAGLDPHRVPLPDPGANPYLACAVILAAGPGRDPGRYELPKEASANIYEHVRPGAPGRGHQAAAASLAEALDAMERSELVAETLGEHVFEWFLRNKRPSGPPTRPRSPRSSSTGTLRRCDVRAAAPTGEDR